jgi:hypothetical protein
MCRQHPKHGGYVMKRVLGTIEINCPNILHLVALSIIFLTIDDWITD